MWLVIDIGVLYVFTHLHSMFMGFAKKRCFWLRVWLGDVGGQSSILFLNQFLQSRRKEAGARGPEALRRQGCEYDSLFGYSISRVLAFS